MIGMRPSFLPGTEMGYPVFFLGRKPDEDQGKTADLGIDRLNGSSRCGYCPSVYFLRLMPTSAGNG